MAALAADFDMDDAFPPDLFMDFSPQELVEFMEEFCESKGTVSRVIGEDPVPEPEPSPDGPPSALVVEIKQVDDKTSPVGKNLQFSNTLCPVHRKIVEKVLKHKCNRCVRRKKFPKTRQLVCLNQGKQMQALMKAAPSCGEASCIFHV